MTEPEEQRHERRESVMSEAAEYRAAKLSDDGERVSLSELLSELDE